MMKVDVGWWRMMKDDEGMIDFKLFWGFGLWQMNERMDKQTFVNVELLSRLETGRYYL